MAKHLLYLFMITITSAIVTSLSNHLSSDWRELSLFLFIINIYTLVQEDRAFGIILFLYDFH